MKNTLFVLLCLSVLLGQACSPSPEKKVEELQQEVLALHDSTMAKMDALQSSKKELTQLRDSLATQDTLAGQAITRGISDLVRSDEQMWQWMRSYRSPEDKQPEEALNYLQQEKIKIEQVRQSIAQSLRAADSLSAYYRSSSK